jgi:hypothetical protein
MMDGCGTFTSAHELLDRLRARQAEIGLSNEALDNLCDFTRGQCDKYLGPARLKFPGLFHLMCMMDALGLSGEFHVDMAKVARMTPSWRLEGRRKMAAIRNENSRISQAMVKRATPQVRSQDARNAVNARWSRTTQKERKQVGKVLALARKKPCTRT